MRLRRGERAERLAAAHLTRAGLQLLERNYRCRLGEIDLIMRDGATLVFVEVRERRHGGFGSGADSVDRRKIRRLVAAAQHYLQNQPRLPPCRFDVVSVDGDDNLTWIPGAFDAG